MKHLLQFSIIAAALGTSVFADESLKADDSVFAKDIKPLLEQHCIKCHGAKKKESGLRLDLKSEALSGGDSGAAIVPGDAEASLLIKYISGADPERIMPPEGDRLTKTQVANFREWIDAGAEWPDGITVGAARQTAQHWAYKPLNRPQEPSLKTGAEWVRNPIDTFVLANLIKHGITPSPEAHRVTLIRRLSLDLLGLPPTPQEVDAFISDKSPAAYEQFVDRLLRSPHFGERWGRHWLDKARYADSDGYEKDRPRPDAWRYRDWVINAVNDDMPLDQFTIEQLAGDMLPNATDMQRLATAFHRQTLTNTEGGTDQEQWRVEAVFDRVETIGTVWLGLTVGCARCHSHKYDQISHREYYQLFAFLNNGDETNANVPKSAAELKNYEVAKAKHDALVAPLQRQLDAARGELAKKLPAWEKGIQAKLAELAKDEIQFHKLEISRVAAKSGAQFTVQKDGSYLVGGTNADTDQYTIDAAISLDKITGFRLEALADKSLPKGGPGRTPNGNFVLNQFQVTLSPTSDRDLVQQPVKFASASADHNQKGWDVKGAIDADPKSGWAVSPEFNKNHHAIFRTTEAIRSDDGKLFLRFTLEQQHGTQHNLGRFRVMAMTGTRANDVVPEAVRVVLNIPADKRDDKQRQQVLDHFISQDAVAAKLGKDLADLQKKAPASPNMSVRIIGERASNRRKTRIMRRGDFLSPMGEVEPVTLSTLHTLQPAKKDSERSRLDFAKWLMSEDNPLTPRVLANQVWFNLFGAGLVTTLNDFGVRGDRPALPELLDWLGTEFRQLGWSRKAFIKRIVMSATYRQSSYHRPELQGVDPRNRLLARQNRVRLQAESIRDAVLAASGLLSRKVGGPSVFPPMPAEIAALSYANNFNWATSKGEDRYRRGMYTFFKRTAPHPNLTMFDCPDSNTTCVERRTSNTPLQALTVLNNETFVEAARALARQATSDVNSATDSSRIAIALRACVGRMPSEVETHALETLVREARQWYAGHEDDAKKLAGGMLPKDIKPAEFAAWVATARIVLNLDEVIMRE
ncbi:MAG: PSD1 and planctomycete cytochrome C domain-containing protein [Planctomycetota bacterium]|nr:PSD1 and planctomycete cytochrome C domain-containing protein [Planctomycetota bacterium]